MSFFFSYFSLLFKNQEDEEKAADADVRKKLFSKPKCFFFGCVCGRACAMTCMPKGMSALLMGSSVFACIAILSLSCAQWQNSMKWQKSQQIDLPHEAEKTAVIILHVISTIPISESYIRISIMCS